MNEAMKKLRPMLLPWVMDWKDPQDHVRNEEKVSRLSYVDWFWCHPTAYVLTQYTATLFLQVAYFGLLVSFVIKKRIFFSIVLLIMFIVQIFNTIKKFKDYNTIKITTHYDRFLRD